MLKKSLLLSIALLGAVLLVFTGCEGPTGPAGQQGSTEVGSVDVTIKGPDAAAPLLPEGVTYPDGNAKVLAGNAGDIALAFNGGILVANTGDVDGTEADNGNVTYGQEPVDAVIWTGSGTKVAVSEGLGSISVPPGKTLYINAPLTLDAANVAGAFTGISISDAGTVNASVVQQSLQGGAPVNTARGKVVLLSGGSITGNGAGSITNGGALEIHRGAKIDVNASVFTAVSGSETLVYGEISNLATADNSFDGLLDIKAGGTVAAANILDNLINGKVKVDGILQVNGADLGFRDTIEVGPAGALGFNTNVTLYNKVTLNGSLDAGATVTLSGPASHLEITGTGSITGGNWANFRYDNGYGTITSGDDKVLLAALADSSPNDNNCHITIAAGSGTIYLRLNVTATSYANLVQLAASETLHLNSIVYSIPLTSAEIEKSLLIAKDNVVFLEVAAPPIDAIGDVTVQAGGSLRIAGGLDITSAGTITIIGQGRPGVATLDAYADAFVAPGTSFGTDLAGLTIGNDAGTITEVALLLATLAGGDDETAIVVHKNATLGLSPYIVDPQGTIELKDGDSGKENGGAIIFAADDAIATFANLKKLTVGKEASFSSRFYDTDAGGDPLLPFNTITFASLTDLVVNGTLEVLGNGITFEKLAKLTVNGSLTVPSNNLTYGTNPLAFSKLQNSVDGANDVIGTGKAVFAGWTVDGLTLGHAFDQILGIKDVTVGVVTNVPGTSGFAAGYTPDRAPAKGDGYKLRVNSITAVGGSLLIDRDLHVANLGAINFGALNPSSTSITIADKIGVYSGTALVLGGPDQSGNATLTSTTANALLTAGAGQFASSVGVLTLATGGTLQIPGTLALGTSFATAGTAPISIASSVNSYLTKAAVSSQAADSTITVNDKGTLGIGANSTAALGSTITLNGTGKVVTAAGTTFEFTATGALLTAGSTLQAAPGGNAAIITSRIPGTGTEVSPHINEAKIDGHLILSGGSFTYTHTVAIAPVIVTRLSILAAQSSIKTQTGSNAYDTAKLGNATISRDVVLTSASSLLVVTFNGIDGRIVLNDATTRVLIGSLLTTTGTGALQFLTNSPNPAATLATGTSNGQAVTLTLPELRGNGIEGGLGLTGDGSVLTLWSTFNVLSAATANTSAALSVSGNAKVVGAGGSLVLLGAAGRSGSFTNGTFTLRGVETGGPVGTYDNGIKTVPDGEVVTLGVEDFYGAFGTGLDVSGTLTTTNGSQIAIPASSVTIPLAATKSLTAGSRLYSTD